MRFFSLLLFPFVVCAQSSEWPGWRELSKAVSVEKDLVYTEIDGRALKLDLYRPTAEKGAVLPVVLMIHGGAWVQGNKKTCWRQSAMLAREGFAVACVEYRLLPDAKIADCVKDCKAAVRFLRANAEKHKLDPARIAAMGGSAGGHLAAMLAVSHGTAALEGKGGHEDASSAVQAAVPMAMPSDLDNGWTRRTFKMSSEQARQVSPSRYVNRKQAPMLLLHCRADTTVPYFSSTAFKLLCKGVDAPCGLVEVKHGGHAFWHSPKGFEETLKVVCPFLNKHLAGKASASK